jgi:hypothetical protein
VRLLALCALALVLSSCRESPARGFERFYDALVAGDDDAVKLLSARAQAQLQQAAAPRGLSAKDALQATFPKTTIRALKVVEDDGAHAVLEVTDPLGKSERVHMVLEDARWKVDLGP